MGAILLSPGMGARAQSPAPSPADDRTQSQMTPRPGGLPREVIILNNGSDIGEFWKKLKQPDLILIKPNTPSSPPAPAIPAATSSRPRDQVVNAVKIRGRVNDDLADLELEIDLGLLAPGEAWVPLGIDSPIIGSARGRKRAGIAHHGARSMGSPARGGRSAPTSVRAQGSDQREP